MIESVYQELPNSQNQNDDLYITYAFCLVMDCNIRSQIFLHPVRTQIEYKHFWLVIIYFISLGNVMSCHTTSSHIMSCHVMSCQVMSCHVMSRHVVSCHIMSHHITSRHLTSSHVVSCHITSYHVT